jgi:hypothetical protein
MASQERQRFEGICVDKCAKFGRETWQAKEFK